MMGRSHVVAGVIAGELVAQAAHLDSVEARLVLAGVGGFGGYVPDLDCGSSTVTRMLGPVGWVASKLLRGFSHVLYAVTKGPADEDCQGEHRHASHTVIFAAIAGLAVVAGCWPWRDRLPVDVWLLGAALAAGCVSHCVTDSATLAGCPFLFPVPIGRETWYEIKILGPLAFRTGGMVETVFVRPVLMVGAVVLWPGVWPQVVNMVHTVRS